MVSLRRRQIILAGFGSLAAPAALYAAQGDGLRRPHASAEEKLVLSGRVLGPAGKPLAGATVEVGYAARNSGGSVLTDGDGRFVLVTTTPAGRREQLRYRVTCAGHATEGQLSKQQRDENGTWRTTFGLTLA